MPDYHRTLGSRLLAGRFTGLRDTRESPAVAMVNQTFAKRYFPGEDAVGKRVAWDEIDGKPKWFRIVGVTSDFRQESLGAQPYPEVYVPEPQRTDPALTVVMRTVNDPVSLAPAARRTVREIDPNLPVFGMESAERILSGSLSQQRMVGILLTAFATLALALAMLGIYGVISYAVARRTREFGVRTALGAGRSDILRLVLGRGIVLAAAGIAAGTGLALGLTRVMRSMLFGIEATDLATFAITCLLLALAGVTACYLPARRALRVDPLTALRDE